jgi:uncharacterized protein with ParB-like and HNH nuclease domain/predicted transport protein
MKAQDIPLTQLLEGSKQFIIPIFQRTYSWSQSHCQQLWDDIVRVGNSSELNSHFVGSVVYIPQTKGDAALPCWSVIDGQQRLTTITLLLIALKKRLAEEGLEKPISAAEVEDYYLRNRYGKGNESYRVLLTRTDKQTLVNLIDCKELGEDASYRIVENFSFFTEQIAKADLEVVWKGIKKLMIVDVCLQQGIDDPQMIFESMNSTGKALTQADLIRNFVLMGLKHDLQTRLYNDYWRPMEVKFGAENYIKEFDVFMRYYLVIHTGNVRIRIGDVYDHFKAYSRKSKLEELLESIKEFAGYYCRIALGTEKDKVLTEVIHDIRELRAEVCYPMLMELYQDFAQKQLTLDELVEVLRMVEGYIFRRAICDIPTNSMRQTFATFMRKVKKDRYVESVKASFLTLPSYRRFPADNEFIRQIQIRNLYKFNRRSYWLRRFENNKRKERVPVQDYTIEHIMPQNENLCAQWRADLGENWREVHEKYLHTLGNLTLTGYNSEYSDRPFLEKRDMAGGFKDSPLKLNNGLRSCEAWNEAAINKRAEGLAQIAATIWQAPDLDEDALQAYKPKISRKARYTIADHPHLQGGASLELFNSFRGQVLALDECVKEEFLKLYVAYKAETNFVDVIPQANGLRLTLNASFLELDDPKGLCRDVTNLGKWGNGNAEVYLKDMEDLAYVIGIVSQALEKQLGEEEQSDMPFLGL